MDRTTLILSAARFAAAIARLCLGPLLPLLSVELGFAPQQKPLLLSAYSAGYILTQLGGGVLADHYGAPTVISGAVSLSAILLLLVTQSTSTTTWIRIFFGLGFVAGPLFPAGSTAISTYVVPQSRAAAAAMVDAAAAAGTTVAALAPLLADWWGNWRIVYYSTSLALAMVAVASWSWRSVPSVPSQESTQTKKGAHHASTTTNEKYPTAALWSPAAVATYICHSADNFTKYSINAWAATLLLEQYGASPSRTGTMLAVQEAVGVVSRLLVGTCIGNRQTTPSFMQRGLTSAGAFLVQGVAQYAAFSSTTSFGAASMLVVSAVAVGAHSIGFRPVYYEAAPPHAGAVSGLGNTIASLASIAGPATVGYVQGTTGWRHVGLVLMLVNLGGAVAAWSIARVGKTQPNKLLHRSD